MKKIPNIYRPLAQTIVTEIRQFSVDTARRSSINNFSVATKITEAEFEKRDIVITPEKPYVLADVHNIVSIQTPHPITVEMVSHGLMPEEPVRSEQVFHDAEISVGPALAGRFVEITVTDKDIFTAAPLEADAFNLRTGETETVQLNRIDQGVYRGMLSTQNDAAKGVDFDGVMYCQRQDILRISYAEAYGVNGKSREITRDAQVDIDFKETTIDVPETIPFDEYLNFQVANPASNVAKVTNRRTGTSKEFVLFNKAPIHLTVADGDLAFECQEGDTFVIETLGKDKFNRPVTISQEFDIALRGVTLPSLTFNQQHDISKPFTITLRDDDLPDSPTVEIRNGYTLVTTSVQMTEEYPYSGRYHATLENIAALGLPGQPLSVSYGENSQGEPRISESLSVVMPVQECANPVVEDSGVVASAPVTFVVNGHFFLNGSFAGTIKLMSEIPVRCTVVKA